MSSCLLAVSALPICHVILSTCSVVLSSLVPRPVRAILVTSGGLEPTSLTGDVTSEITDDDWERGRVLSTCYVVLTICHVILSTCSVALSTCCVVLSPCGFVLSISGGILKSRLDPGLDFGFRKKLLQNHPPAPLLKFGRKRKRNNVFLWSNAHEGRT